MRIAVLDLDGVIGRPMVLPMANVGHGITGADGDGACRLREGRVDVVRETTQRVERSGVSTMLAWPRDIARCIAAASHGTRLKSVS